MLIFQKEVVCYLQNLCSGSETFLVLSLVNGEDRERKLYKVVLFVISVILHLTILVQQQRISPVDQKRDLFEIDSSILVVFSFGLVILVSILRRSKVKTNPLYIGHYKSIRRSFHIHSSLR